MKKAQLHEIMPWALFVQRLLTHDYLFCLLYHKSASRTKMARSLDKNSLMIWCACYMYMCPNKFYVWKISNCINLEFWNFLSKKIRQIEWRSALLSKNVNKLSRVFRLFFFAKLLQLMYVSSLKSQNEIPIWNAL